MDTLTLTEILQAETASIIPKIMYVWHDEVGTITGISNLPSTGEYLEVPKSRLHDFLSGKKDYCRYNIDYFKFDNALQTKDESIKISSALIYEIPRVTDNGITDFTIIHDKQQKRWQILLSDDAKDMISKINPSTTFDFYLTATKDPHYLLKTITVPVSNMKDGNKLQFEDSLEEDADSFTISTFGYFKSYGLLVV